MKAITVRKLGTNELLAFGQDDGMYDPGVPPGAIKTIEPDYTTVQAEYAAAQPPLKPATQVLVDQLIADPVALSGLKAALAKP